MVKIITSSDKFNEKVCPSCKQSITLIYFKNMTLDAGINFKDSDEIPEELKYTGSYPSVYFFGCPKCKNIFFGYLK